MGILDQIRGSKSAKGFRVSGAFHHPKLLGFSPMGYERSDDHHRKGALEWLLPAIKCPSSLFCLGDEKLNVVQCFMEEKTKN